MPAFSADWWSRLQVTYLAIAGIPSSTGYILPPTAYRNPTTYRILPAAQQCLPNLPAQLVAFASHRPCLLDRKYRYHSHTVLVLRLAGQKSDSGLQAAILR